MAPAITITSYALPDFIKLNIRACRAIWPGVDILVSDDLSPSSPEIKEICAGEGASYLPSSGRMGHCAGDFQGLLNALAWGEANQAISLKLSQRLIPCSNTFREAFEATFADPDCWIAQPGQLNKAHMSRPSGRFYTHFGRLSDVVAMRPEKIDRNHLVEFYREANAVKASQVQVFVEVALGNYIDRNLKDHARTVEAWTNSEPGQPKALLRKTQSSLIEYLRLAERLGIPNANYSLSEWREIEKGGYKCLPTSV